MDKKPYQLICSYLKGTYFISTVYRQSSATIEDLWYFETLVWRWDGKAKDRGNIIEMEDSGFAEDMALYSHLAIAKRLNALLLESEESLKT